MFHVKILCKIIPLTRHLERSETKSKDLNYCLFTSNSISERNPNKLLMYLRYIYFCYGKSVRSPQSIVLKSKI